MSETNKNFAPGYFPSGAQDVDKMLEPPSYRLLEKKVIFPSIDSFLYHWTNTFDVRFDATKTKGGGLIYKLKLVPKPTTDYFCQGEVPNNFPATIEYVTFAIEHHNIARDEPSEYDSNGRIHFVVPPSHVETSEMMKSVEQKWVENEQRKFAILINKLNAQLSLDYPSEHKRSEYFKELPEYKINMSKYAKFKFEKFLTTEGLTCIDIAFAWIIDDFKDTTATQGITLNLNGYKYRYRDALAELTIVNSQRKRKETLETKKKESAESKISKEETVEPTPKKKRCPDLKVEVGDTPELIGDRYEIIPQDAEKVPDEAEKNAWLKLAKKYGVAPPIDIV